MGFASRKSVLEMGTMIPCHIQIPWKRLVGLLLNTRIAQSSCGRQDITRRSSSRSTAAGRPLRGSFVATPRSPLCFGVSCKSTCVMTRELIKKKHFPLAVALGLVGYFAVRYGLCDFRETTQELADRITETGLFF